MRKATERHEPRKPSQQSCRSAHHIELYLCMARISSGTVTPLCIFSGVTACNKSFYIGFAFLRHEDKDSYHWVLSQVHELYTRVGQENGAEVVLTDKDDALIAGLGEVMTTSHHILCVWHINKNVMARATKFFEGPDQVKAWMDKWYKVCQAPTLAEYQQARGEL